MNTSSNKIILRHIKRKVKVVYHGGPPAISGKGLPRNSRNARKEPVALIEFEEETKGSQQNPCPLDRT